MKSVSGVGAVYFRAEQVRTHKNLGEFPITCQPSCLLRVLLFSLGCGLRIFSIIEMVWRPQGSKASLTSGEQAGLPHGHPWAPQERTGRVCGHVYHSCASPARCVLTSLQGVTMTALVPSLGQSSVLTPTSSSVTTSPLPGPAPSRPSCPQV